jgi:teichuronic acid biosynthesis glycosyltransferase TuaG
VRTIDVTVGLVVRSGGELLRSSVATALSQVHCRHAPVVIVDDASPPDTARVLDQFAQRDERIVLVRNGRPRGLAAGRNQVLERARTSLLAWLEPGLLWRPRALELQAARLEQEGDLVLSAIAWRRISDGHVRLIRPPSSCDPRELLRGRLAPRPGTTLMRTQLLRGLGGYDERLAHFGDHDLLLRFARAGGRLVTIEADGPLATEISPDARDDPAGLVTGLRRLHGKHREASVANGRDFALRCRAEAHASAATRHKAEGRRGRAQVHRIAAAGLHMARTPTNARRRIDRAAPSKETQGPDDALSSHQTPGGANRQDGERREAASPRRGHACASPRTRDGRDDDAPSPTRPTPRVARLEAFAQEQDWVGAVGLWEELDGEDEESMSDATLTLVARSLRALGRYREAVDLALDGLERWPGAAPIRKELYKSRAALVDWSTALRSTAAATGPRDDAVGVVHSLGALAGGAGPIRGEVRTAHRAPSVSLVLNGLTVATTHAAADERETDSDLSVRAFTLNVQQVREYLGDGDVLEIVCLGRPLAVTEYGARISVHTGYPSRYEDLRDRLDAGAVFIKTGQLRKGNSPKRKRSVLDLFERVSEMIEEEHGHRCYPFYGNLLGAVREHDLIAHDVGGFDMGYVSHERQPAAVRAEVLEVAATFLRKGFHVSLVPWAVMVRSSPGDDIFMDLNYAWFTHSGELQMSYGWRYEPAHRGPTLLGRRLAPLYDRCVPVPLEAELLLEQWYGPTWTIPDQGFDLDARLVRAPEFLLTVQDMRGLEAAWPEMVRIELLPDDPRALLRDESTGDNPPPGTGQGTKSSRG